MEGAFERVSVAVGRALSGLVNRLLPGKRRAALLLVANPRTAAAMPPAMAAPVVEFVENGVDLSLWAASAATPRPAETSARYVFLGRLVDWKAVDLLLRAFARASAIQPMSPLIAGDGPERCALEELAGKLGLLSKTALASGQVEFAGWKSQRECMTLLAESDALVLPSMFECGGAVVLEAMAMSLPVIATNWGGPADYLDPSCGILVEPRSHEAFVEGMASALVRLARAPEERQRMGRSGRAKVEAHYDWEIKADRMLALYRQVLAAGAGSSRDSI